MSERASVALENAMIAVAKRAASEVKDNDVLGLGSGSAVTRFASSLGLRVREEKLRLAVVPSSMQALLLARENGLPLHQDSGHCPNSLDLSVDGADQVAIPGRSMIKGGGGQLLKEKIVLSSSNRNLILIDSTKIAKKLGRSVPIEISQFALDTVKEKLKRGFGAEVELRKLEKGYPYYTESGNIILDAVLGELDDPKGIEDALKCIPGVVEVGIFNCRVDRFLVGNHDGLVEEI